MESARAHSFSLILIAFLFLALGFLAGFWGIHLFSRGSDNKEIKHYPAVAGDTIMHKRIEAIKEAQEQGRDDYEFEISGLQPILH
jgi:hypothetical protein